MIDAYTIGITLALNDGVSDGIAAIRRDLVLLDTAMNTSTTRLQTLRKLASEIVFPGDHERSVGQIAASPPAPGGKAEKAVPLAADAAPIMRSPPSTPNATQMPATPAMAPVVAPDPRALPAPAIEPSPTSLPRVPALQSVVLPPLAPRPSTPVPVPALAARRDQTAAVAPLPAQVAAPPNADRSIAFKQIGSSALGPGKDLPTARATAPADLPAPLSRGDATLPAPLPLVGAAAAAPSAAVSSFAPSISPAVMKQAARDTSRRSAAPVSASPALAPAIGTPSSAPAQAAAPAAVSAQPGAATTVQAEIHLDGSVLGRWVTRHLERQVLRPPAGATGFDPRMTPSWPGAPTGN